MIALETAAQRPTATRRATVLGPEVLALTACVVLLAHCRAPAALLLSGEIASVIGLLGANVVMGRSRYFAAELATVTLAVLLTHYALAPIADVQTPMTSPILLVAVNCLVVHRDLQAGLVLAAALLRVGDRPKRPAGIGFQSLSARQSSAMGRLDAHRPIPSCNASAPAALAAESLDGGASGGRDSAWQ
jgi:hypothetical protein